MFSAACSAAQWRGRGAADAHANCESASLSGAPRTHHFRLSARWRERHLRSADRSMALGAPWPAILRGESTGCGRQHCRGDARAIIVAPHNTPAEITRKLNQEIKL